MNLANSNLLRLIEKNKKSAGEFRKLSGFRINLNFLGGLFSALIGPLEEVFKKFILHLLFTTRKW